MSEDLSPTMIDVLIKERERQEQWFHSIGLFLFSFSQLEFTIRHRLAGALGLANEHFDIVTAPYDFAKLCNVTKALLIQQTPLRKEKISKLFSGCHKLNDARVVVAHGLWTDDGVRLMARHVSRDKLEYRYYYTKPEDLDSRSEEAKKLMADLLEIDRD